MTPSSIVYLVVKLRLVPPSKTIERRELNVDETKRAIKSNDEKDEKFLTGRAEMEELVNEDIMTAAHAPYWPGVRHASPSFLLTFIFVYMHIGTQTLMVGCPR